MLDSIRTSWWQFQAFCSKSLCFRRRNEAISLSARVKPRLGCREVSGNSYRILGILGKDFMTCGSIAAKESLRPASYRLSSELAGRSIKVEVSMDI